MATNINRCCGRNIVLDQILGIIPSSTCTQPCLTIDDIGDLPNPLVCDFVYYSPTDQQLASYYIYNFGLAQWDGIYSIISVTQVGADFTQIRIDLLAGWSFSVDSGTTWIVAAGIHAINSPAPMTVSVRNDATGCIYVGQTFEAEYTIWLAQFDNGGSWPMAFDCGSYGSGSANDNNDYANFLQANVTPESGSGYFGTNFTAWITLLKGLSAPVDWTFGAGTPINFAQQTSGLKVFSCLRASYSVANASLWLPYSITDVLGIQGEIFGTTTYDQAGIQAIVSSNVTNMYGATSSATVGVTGNNIVFTIMNTMILTTGTIDSTEDFIGFQADPFSELPCP